jgi:hypothetical protein
MSPNADAFKCFGRQCRGQPVVSRNDAASIPSNSQAFDQSMTVERSGCLRRQREAMLRRQLGRHVFGRPLDFSPTPTRANVIA